MGFDGKAFHQLKDWWHYHGNPNIIIWEDWFGNIVLLDRTTLGPVGLVEKFLNDDYWSFHQYWTDYPITKAERKQIAKFVKASNDRRKRMMNVTCEYCGNVLVPGDRYWEWECHAFCSYECARDYIFDNAELIEKVVGKDN